MKLNVCQTFKLSKVEPNYCESLVRHFISYALAVSFQIKILFLKYCGSEVNRLPDICPAKTGLFGISRELQFRVCNHGKTSASPHKVKEESLYGWKRMLGGLRKQGSHSFSLAESRVFPLLTELCGITGFENSPFWSSSSICLFMHVC